MNIIFRKSQPDDIPQIMEIICQAQECFKLKGVDQWQNNYPNISIINADIETETSYVITDNQIVIGTVVVSFNGEDSYNKIYNGQWLSNQRYAVVHRMAISNQHKGLGYASHMFKEIENLCVKNNICSIKVDTHQQNLTMLKLLPKNGFIYCGTVLLEDNSERMAYEKLI